MRSSKVFQVFPSFDEVKTDTESNVQILIKGEGEGRYLSFNKAVRLVELNKLEALKIAFALLGRIAICEICGTPYRRKGSTGLHAKTRFCSRECFYEWCRRTGGTLGLRAIAKLGKAQWHPEELDNVNVIDLEERLEVEVKVKKTVSRQERVQWGRKGGRRTQALHPHVRRNLKRGKMQ